MSSPTAVSSSKINPDLLMGSKLRAHYQENFREHVSAPTSAFAKKQLEKMGWTEGTGLGKNRDGIQTHIKVKKRKEKLGVGGSEKPDIVVASEAMGEWWKDGLGDTLARLGSKKKDKKKGKKDKKEKKKKAKKYTDEELFEATGGARFGMRAGITNNLHKWVRTEKSKGGTSEEEEEEEENTKKPVEVAEDSSQDSSAEKKKSKKRKLENDDNDDTPSLSKEEDAEKSKKDKKEKKDKKKKKRKLAEEEQEGGDTLTISDKEKLRKEKKEAKRAKKKKSKD